VAVGHSEEQTALACHSNVLDVGHIPHLSVEQHSCGPCLSVDHQDRSSCAHKGIDAQHSLVHPEHVCVDNGLADEVSVGVQHKSEHVEGVDSGKQRSVSGDGQCVGGRDLVAGP